MHSPTSERPQTRGRPDFAYESTDGLFDETVFGESEVRSHWRPFFEQLDTIGLPEFLRRWEEAKHLIRENGVTYNVYGDPRGMERPWELDPVPLLVSPVDSETIEDGLTQRALLLDRILADLYGPQTLLTASVIPPELVLGHPGYLRPCHGLVVPSGRYLHLYAADLGRSPQGVFHVLRDRTQAPSGAGYALENRIVLSRMLPEVFRDCRVQRLATFFKTLRESLRSIAPRNRDNPRVVLLTPGPFNETYFEHAFLARYLGYTLVEGGDLTVRDNIVYLKLLGGLQPVDVILRRLDDDYCDPLELRGDSFLGVPGLVQAARAGNVAVANALGTGLVETPALLAYLPAACRHLLGQELRLPSVPTWWCGDPVSLQHVLTHLDRMVVKPTYPQEGGGTIFCENLDEAKRAVLADKIRARPGNYVGQERLVLSTTPVLNGERLEPRRMVVRAYLTAAGASGHALMPGALTRVAPAEDTQVVSMQRGAGSKDAWFLSSGPVSSFSLLPAGVRSAEVRRDGGDIPSRAADDLFWLGRYTERVEGTVRLIRAILSRLTEKSGLVDVPELPALLRALTEQTMTLPGFIGLGAEARIAAPAEELFTLLFDESKPGGLASTIDTLHRVAGRVRDRISNDMWRIIVSLDLNAESPHSDRIRPKPEGPSGGTPVPLRGYVSRRVLGEALDLLDRKVIALAAFGGMAAESMTRGQGWRFLDMGRRLERALHTLGLIRSTVVPVQGTEGPLLEAVLEIADSVMTYRRRYLASLQAAPVLDLLLSDADNPRSLAFQLNALSTSIDALPRTPASPSPSSKQRIITRLLNRLRDTDLESLAQVNTPGHRTELASFLVGMEAELPLISDALTRTYLTHLPAARQYASEAARP